MGLHYLHNTKCTTPSIVSKTISSWIQIVVTYPPITRIWYTPHCAPRVLLFYNSASSSSSVSSSSSSSTSFTGSSTTCPRLIAAGRESMSPSLAMYCSRIRYMFVLAERSLSNTYVVIQSNATLLVLMMNTYNLAIWTPFHRINLIPEIMYLYSVRASRRPV